MDFGIHGVLSSVSKFPLLRSTLTRFSIFRSISKKVHRDLRLFSGPRIEGFRSKGKSNPARSRPKFAKNEQVRSSLYEIQFSLWTSSTFQFYKVIHNNMSVRANKLFFRFPGPYQKKILFLKMCIFEYCANTDLIHQSALVYTTGNENLVLFMNSKLRIVMING